VVAGSVALDTIAAPKKVTDGVAINERFVPEGKGLRYEIETTYTGMAANAMRRSMAETRAEDLARRYADYYRKRYGALEVAVAPTVQDDRERNTMKVREAYVLADPFQLEGTAVRALDVYGLALDEATEPPHTLVRKGPLDIGQPTHFSHDIEFQVPAGWRPTFGEEEEKVVTDAYNFALAIKRGDAGDAKVAVHYQLDVKGHDLPADRANAHLADLRRMRDLLSSRLRFTAPAERLGAKERDERLKALLRGAMDDKKSTE
jgi:hypothetical protein